METGVAGAVPVESRALEKAFCQDLLILFIDA
jgi:hypothetical protein